MFHFIDIENLCGSGAPTEGEIFSCIKAYAKATSLHPNDRIFVASAHKSEKAVKAALSRAGLLRAQQLVRPGENGADRALVEAMEKTILGQEHLRSSKFQVVLGSGDHAFAEPLFRINHKFVCQTLVVALKEGSLSGELWANYRTRFLTDFGFEGSTKSKSVQNSQMTSWDWFNSMPNGSQSFGEGVSDLGNRLGSEIRGKLRAIRPEKREMVIKVETLDWKGTKRIRVFASAKSQIATKNGQIHPLDPESDAWKSLSVLKAGQQTEWLSKYGRVVIVKVIEVTEIAVE